MFNKIQLKNIQIDIAFTLLMSVPIKLKGDNDNDERNYQR